MKSVTPLLQVHAVGEGGVSALFPNSPKFCRFFVATDWILKFYGKTTI